MSSGQLIIRKILSTFFLLLGVLALSACSDGGSSVDTSSKNGGGVSLPAALKTTLPANGTLQAFIIVDRGERQPMSVGDNNASVQLTDLSEGDHRFEIVFEFVFDATPETPLLLASVSKVNNVGAGNNILNITETDYIVGYDNDSDGISNIVELASGSSPYGGFAISSISGNTTETGVSASFTIALTAAPVNDVVITLSSSNALEGSIDENAVTFTSENWNAPQTVTVTGINDEVVDGNVDYAIRFTEVASVDSNYNAQTIDDLGIINIDNDSPGFNISPISGATSEAGGSATFTVQLTTQPSSNVSIDINSDNTAEGTIDKTVLTFTQGDWNTAQTVTVTGEDDNVEDGDQTYAINFASAVSNDNNYNNLTPVNVNVINTDDEGNPTVSLSIINSSINEDGGAAIVYANLSGLTNQPVTVNLGYRGTATSGTDYSPVTSIIIPPNTLSASANIIATQDVLDENNETIIVDIVSVINSTEEGTQSKIATINDDDQEPIITLGINNAPSLSEASGSINVTATLNKVSGRDVTVNLVYSGSAVSGVDYSKSDTILIEAGNQFGQIALTAIPDEMDESNESIIIDVSTVVNGTEASLQQVPLSIIDDDAPPQVSFSIASRSVNEAVGNVDVSATLDVASSFTVTVPYSVSGSATGSNVDHNLSNGSFSFTPGQTTSSKNVVIQDDALAESDETIVITMGTPTNASTGTITSHTTTITDNDYTVGGSITGLAGAGFVLSNNGADDLPVFAGSSFVFNGTLNSNDSYEVSIKRQADGQFCTVGNASGSVNNANVNSVAISCESITVNFSTAAQRVLESVGNVSVTATLSAPNVTNSSIRYSVSGTATGNGVDHNLGVATINIAAGQTQVTTVFNVQDDLLAEADETIIVTMTSPVNLVVGSVATQTVTIEDNDYTIGGDVIGLSSGSVVLQNNGANDLPINADGNFTFSNAITDGNNYLVSIKTQPVGYDCLVSAGGSGTVAGSNVVNVAVICEQITVAFSSGSQLVAENTGLVTVIAELSTASAYNISVPFMVTGTASQTGGGRDHDLLSGEILISAGQLSAVQEFSITNDVTIEPDETVIVTLGSPLNAINRLPDIHTVTIRDNDFDLQALPQSRSAGLSWVDTGAVSYNLYSSSDVNFDPSNYASFPDGTLLSNVLGLPVFTAANLRNDEPFYFVLEAVYSDIAVQSAVVNVVPEEWKFNGDVLAMVKAADGTLYVGGRFNQVGSEMRNGLAAINPDGSLSDWNPDVSGLARTVNALAINNDILYVGGGFTSISSMIRNNIAAIVLPTNTVTSWDPDVNDEVFAIAVNVDRVYIGGRFNAVGNLTRRGLASVSTLDALPDMAWPQLANGADEINTIKVDLNTVYIGGKFNGFSNVSGINNLAAINLNGAVDIAWEPSPDNRVRAISIEGDQVYLGGRFNFVSGVNRNFLAAVGTVETLAQNGGNLLSPWNPNPDNDIDSLTTFQGSIFVGGSFNTVDDFNGSPVLRSQIAEIRPDGSITNWQPNVSLNDNVLSILADPENVYFGGNFTSIDGRPRSSFATVDRIGNLK